MSFFRVYIINAPLTNSFTHSLPERNLHAFIHDETTATKVVFGWQLAIITMTWMTPKLVIERPGFNTSLWRGRADCTSDVDLQAQLLNPISLSSTLMSPRQRYSPHHNPPLSVHQTDRRYVGGILCCSGVT